MRALLLAMCLFSSVASAGEPIYLMNDAENHIIWQSINLKPGEDTTLFQTEGAGVIQRIWMTSSRPNPVNMKRFESLTIKIFWDGSENPAVEAPLYDFFNQPFGPQRVNNGLTASDGDLMTFCIYVPMPFRNGAVVKVHNGNDAVERLYYEVFAEKKEVPPNALYFHTQFHNSVEHNSRVPVLNQIDGRGRYLGMHVSVFVPNPNKTSWKWYTRKVDFSIDQEEPGEPNLKYGTIDDFIGSGWWSVNSNMKAFELPYYGLNHVSYTDNGALQVSFYRYYIKDPVWFQKNLAVSLSNGGNFTWRALSYFYLDTPEKQ